MNTRTIISRSNTIRPFDPSRIERAIMGALNDEMPHTVDANRRSAAAITVMVVEQLDSKFVDNVVSVEEIQDTVEVVLMKEGLHRTARNYILYREAKASRRKDREPQAQPEKIVVYADGSTKPFDMPRITHCLVELMQRHEIDLDVGDADSLAMEIYKSIVDGGDIKALREAALLACRSRVEVDPNFTYLAAHFLNAKITEEVQGYLCSAGEQVSYGEMFERYVEAGLKNGRLNSKFNKFELNELAAALKPELDESFTYLGLQTLYDRYLIRDIKGAREVVYETPQFMFMRVAMGLAMNKNESEPHARAIEFYNLLSSFDYMTSTPTLFNSGTVKEQLSSCYLTTIPDDLEGIYDGLKQNALLSKFAGGLGNDWTPVRSLGAYINGTNGKSQGVVPFLKVANDTAVAVNQGGKRKGAVCAYLETWHADIEEFLDLRKNTGDDRRRTHDMNTANWVPDLFMKRLFADEKWSLFSPDETPDLHDLYGQEFERAYVAYEQKGQQGQLRVFRQVEAKQLWRKMLSMLFETGHPWICFKDPCNIRSPQQHVGVVHSSNLCTEITLNTSADEVAVCNLGSVNLARHITDGKLDMAKLERTVKTAVRMLDNVIDINYYSVSEAGNSNLRHRPVGLGMMGFQDALYELGVPYGSQAAVEFADRSMEAISYFAINASADLADERGAYASFDGSLWSQGIVPVMSMDRLASERGKVVTKDGETDGLMRVQSSPNAFDWQAVSERVKKGMRNSNVMAIAPTATISNIVGVTQSIEPTYQHLYTKSNLSGEFTVINPYLVAKLKELGLWDKKMVHELKFFDGSVQGIERIPEEIRNLFATSFEVPARWLVLSAAARQKWIDQAQSLNLYIANPNGKKLDELYRLAWVSGLKTTYYLRAKAATKTESSTAHDNALNAVQSTPQPEEQVPAAFCTMEEGCEVCQ